MTAGHLLEKYKEKTIICSDFTPNSLYQYSLEDMAHDLILGHNRCFFAYSGRVHPTHE